MNPVLAYERRTRAEPGMSDPIFLLIQETTFGCCRSYFAVRFDIYLLRTQSHVQESHKEFCTRGRKRVHAGIMCYQLLTGRFEEPKCSLGEGSRQQIYYLACKIGRFWFVQNRPIWEEERASQIKVHRKKQ